MNDKKRIQIECVPASMAIRAGGRSVNHFSTPLGLVLSGEDDTYVPEWIQSEIEEIIQACGFKILLSRAFVRTGGRYLCSAFWRRRNLQLTTTVESGKLVGDPEVIQMGIDPISARVSGTARQRSASSAPMLYMHCPRRREPACTNLG